MTEDSLSNLSHETRTFAPSAEFAAQANAKANLYDEAEADRLGFWDKQANWQGHKLYSKVLTIEPNRLLSKCSELNNGADCAFFPPSSYY